MVDTPPPPLRRRERVKSWAQRIYGLQHHPPRRTPASNSSTAIALLLPARLGGSPAASIPIPASSSIRLAAVYDSAYLFLRTAPAFTSSTAPETAAGAPLSLPLPSTGVVLQR